MNYLKKLIIKIIILNLLLVGYVSGAGTFGAITEHEGNAKWIGMGKTFSQLSDGLSAIYYNPASLYYGLIKEISLTYAKPYSKISGISYKAIDIGLPVKKVNFGISYGNFSIEDIREADSLNGLTGNTFNSRVDVLRGSFACKIIERVSGGLSFRYNKEKIQDYSFTNYTFSTGLLYRGNNYRISLFLKNIYSSKDKSRLEDEDYPFGIELGLSYKFINRLTTAFLIRKSSESDIETHYGFHYKVSDNLKLMCGYISETEEISGGLVVGFKKYFLEYAITSHPDLDLTHTVTLHLSIF